MLPVSAQDAAETLTVYSGRSEGLIGPILEQFSAETGVQVEVRYGSTAEMATTILEEGGNSPADVYIAQDAGALGALAAAGRLRLLPSDILERVPAQFEARAGLWVGLSGRARVLVYNTEFISAEQLPASILNLTDPAYAGLVGWAPSNGSFQSQVTAMRLLLGEDAARAWLEGMVANGAIAYENNDAIMQAVIDGEVTLGLVNHYYIFEFLEQTPDAPIALHYFPGGDVGSLINVAGAGILDSSDQPGLAQRLLLYLLGSVAQTYFSEATNEYPLVAGVPANPDLLPLDQIQAPEIDLSDLSDLQGTLDLLRATGALP
ncbi:MAG: iron ABC transporter substrate-binding protein [Chloroflexi bacterium]|nr:iron ABC transporter substrate-binding protein [Chloroflexota bacterium]